MDIQEALAERDTAALQQILKAEPESARLPTAQGVSPLTLAAYMRYDDGVQCIRPLVEPDSFEAAILGEVDTCLGGIRNVEDRSADGFTVVHLAAHFGHPELLNKLIDAGAKADALCGPPMHNTPLHAAASGGSVESIEALLRHGVDVDARDGHGNTALMVAAAGRHEACVSTLLDAGADASVTNSEGHTVRNVVEQRGYPELLDILP